MSLTASRRVAAVTDDLQSRGFTLDDTGWATIAHGDATAIAGVDGSLAVTPLNNSNPLTVVSAVANAAHDGHVPVLVVDDRTGREIEPILSEPFLLNGRREGARRFFPVEDRIRLSDESYACIGTSGQIEWFEEATPETDDPPLVLAVGGETTTRLDSVESLACPGPSLSAFEYSYARGDDGRFRVCAAGEPVGRYTSISAMRTSGFRPAPLPLVPEHHVRSHGTLARATLVTSVTGDDGGVSYRSAL